LRRREIKVGLTVLITIAVLYLVLLWGQRRNPFGPRDHEYSIRFAHISGLLQEDPVSVRGYTAGRVVELIPEADAIRVRIALSPEIALYPNAVAEIQIRELMGGKQIAIDPGNGDAPLPNGSELPGRTAPDFSTAFSDVGNVMDALDPSQAAQIAARADRLLQRFEALASAIDPQKVAQSLDHLAHSSAQIDRLLSQPEIQQAPERLDQSWARLNSTLAQAEATLQLLDAIGRQVESETLPRADSALASLPALLHRSDRLLGRAGSLMRQLENPESMLGRAIYDPVLSRQVDSTLTELIGTLRQIQTKRVVVGFRHR